MGEELKSMNITERIMQYLVEHPKAPNADIVNDLGVPLDNIGYARRKLGAQSARGLARVENGKRYKEVRKEAVQHTKDAGLTQMEITAIYKTSLAYSRKIYDEAHGRLEEKPRKVKEKYVEADPESNAQYWLRASWGVTSGAQHHSKAHFLCTV